MRHIRWVLLAAVAVLALAGCSLSEKGLVDADQLSWDGQSTLALESEQPVGQTFVARHSGLSGVDFLLLPEGGAPQTLTLHLRTDPQATTDLVTASLLLPADATTGFFHFAFPPLADSHGQYYYAFLSSETPGVTVAQAAGEAYLDGAAYQDHEPLDAQTGFRLTYAPRHIALDLARAILGWMGLLAVAGFLFVVPGWALLAWLLPGRRLNWAERLGLAAGVGLALYPLLLLWTDVVGLHLGALYAWLPPLLGSAALIWRYRTWRPAQGWEALRRWARSEARWPDLTLLVLLGLVFGVRLLVVRGLEAPMWGDSYQHTMIAQLLVDNGGLFDSWQPYTEIDRFTYHFGFHSIAATLHWLTGMPVLDAVLWIGQVLNGLAVLALYPLALRVTGSRWGGVWAVLLAGLLSPMPMFYVNWGRYTQLAGLVILPAAVWLTWEAVDRPERSKRLLALAAVAAGGLALTHYRVLIFYAVFVIALALVAWKWESLLRLLIIGAGAGLLFLPWLVHAVGASLVRIFVTQATTAPAQASSFTWEYNAIGRLDTYLGPLWWLMMLLGLGMGLWARWRGVLLTGLWWFLLLLVTNPAWLSLPGTGIISNFALFISVYIPAGLLSGVVVARLTHSKRGRKIVPALLGLLMVGLGLWGARGQMSIPDPQRHALVTRPDVRAASWLRENTPLDAKFLVPFFFAYGGTAVVGSDGGWWLPLLAGRATTVPPLSYGLELRPDDAYHQEITELAHQVQQHGLDDPATLELLHQRGVTHVYVGQRQGRVNYDGAVLAAAQLEQSASYRSVYHQDRVWVFVIGRPE